MQALLGCHALRRVSRTRFFIRFNRLKELDQFKSRFYTNITHEFRTPLTVIKGIAQQIDGQEKTFFPANIARLAKAKPIYETLPGWDEDISAATTFDGGVTWRFQTRPAGPNSNDVFFVDENTGWIVGLSAEQDHRALHHATAQNPVQLTDLRPATPLLCRLYVTEQLPPSRAGIAAAPPWSSGTTPGAWASSRPWACASCCCWASAGWSR